MYRDLLFETIQTPTEEHFNYKCQSLLKYIGKDRIIKSIDTPHEFESLFINNILSNDDINHALLKKCYIVFYNEGKMNPTIKYYINTLDFEGANEALTTNCALRQELFSVYLDYLSISSQTLVIDGCHKNNYDVLYETLRRMNSYYINLKFKSNNNLTLKKSIY